MYGEAKTTMTMYTLYLKWLAVAQNLLQNCRKPRNILHTFRQSPYHLPMPVMKPGSG